LSEAGQLKANRAMAAPFLHHKTKSEILFQNEGKDRLKCDFIGRWIVSRNGVCQLFLRGTERKRVIFSRMKARTGDI
jgi:hypothetical protein